jgi:hypothetical protein
MKTMSDLEIRRKGFRILFKELGEVGTIRFVSQIIHEKRDYLQLQERMSTTQKQQMTAWVKTWKAAGDALKDIKRQELQ